MQSTLMIHTQQVVSRGIVTRMAAWTVTAAWIFLSTASRLSAGVPVWTCDIITDEMSTSTNLERTLKPIHLVGARNGSYSAKVVVESTGPITDVKTSVSALIGKLGGSSIPASNVQLRYGKAWDIRNQYTCPSGADILLESPPPEVAIDTRLHRAVLPVWVTVKVPKDAKAGVYAGHVTVQGDDVPLNLDVQNWTLPDTQAYRTFCDFVESPDSLAVEYNVPLWSEKHWKMIDRAFQLISSCGGSTLYIPLIIRTNFGNEESMVRWVSRGKNQYDYDYTVMDRYLDSAIKNMGKPKLVVFYVWDVCMSADALKKGAATFVADGGKSIIESREALLGKGPRVTAWNPATKATSVLTLPRYESAESRELWGPLFVEIRKRMEKRGLDKAMMLGLMPDLWPNKEEVTFWKSIAGDLPWAIHGHAGARDDLNLGNKGLYKIADIGYAAFVYDLIYNVNLDKGRMYGWRQPSLLSCYERGGLMNLASTLEMREVPAFAITGGQRGCGRLGAEYWPVMRNSKGVRSGPIYARYPENNWRNLDICDWFLAPGPDGPVATARLESLREGLQVCEARIFLEDALLDQAKKAAIGSDLAKRCQDALDEHHRAMWKTAWNNDEDLKMLGKVAGRNPGEALIMNLIKAGRPYKYSGEMWHPLINEEARKGKEQFVIGWQEREKKLFALAGEVAAKLTPGKL